MAEYLIVIRGAAGVGKSALVVQCECLISLLISLTSFAVTRGYFVEDYDPTIEDSYRKQVVVDGEVCILEMLDCANEEYSSMHDSYMRMARGFIVVYAIINRNSFTETANIHEQCLRVKDEDSVPMVLVGNKCDLEENRSVTVEEGQKLASSFGCPFFESSAKTRLHVEDIFFQLVREVRKETQRLGAKGSAHRGNGRLRQCRIL